MLPLQIAVELAATGIPCFPVAHSKCPTTPHGLKDASTDANMLRELWANYPGPLVGIRTGAISDLDALDIDKTTGAREWFAANRHRLPPTRVHRTRSGGLHLLFRHADDLRCCGLRVDGKIMRGLDIKGNDGCLTWWPAAGLPVLCDDRPARWPSWLLDILKPAPPPSPRAVLPDDLQLHRILKCVAAAQAGERNRLAFWGACRLGEMATAGLLHERDAIGLIVDAAMASGLPRSEALAAAKSGLRRGR